LHRHRNRADFYYTPQAQKLALKEILARNGEGVVFKLLDAPYTAGRPNSGGTWLKCKFWAEVDVIVRERRAGKRSVGMQIYDDQGGLVQIDNVTIPANYHLPLIGAGGGCEKPVLRSNPF
jgi:bifunctional non-homologous end joining protein LigD